MEESERKGETIICYYDNDIANARYHHHNTKRAYLVVNDSVRYIHHFNVYIETCYRRNPI